MNYVLGTLVGVGTFALVVGLAIGLISWRTEGDWWGGFCSGAAFGAVVAVLIGIMVVGLWAVVGLFTGVWS